MVYPFQTHLINCFVFIDCENVNPKEAFDFLETHKFLNLQTQIVCLIGADKNQNNWYNDFKNHVANVSANIAPIRLSKAGRKSDQLLDKILLTYVGFVIGQNQLAEICILAKDRGYENIAEHFKSAGVNITHENISEKQNKNPPAKKAASTIKQTVAKNKETKTEQKESNGNTKTTTQKTQVEKETINQKGKKEFNIEDAKEKIMQQSKTKRPKEIEKLKNYINNNFNSSDLDADTTAVIENLKSDGIIEINGEIITWKK